MLSFLIRRRKYIKKPKINVNYQKHKETARKIVTQQLAHFNQFYQFSYFRIAIRDQKTRWGSCSIKGNLNFNYRLVYLEPDLINYVIVHEMCHLKEFNHSFRFWDLVKLTIPNYKTLRKSLKSLRFDTIKQ